jgi:mannose-6-phosphate isomerase-like protein (cupin superfamily)
MNKPMTSETLTGRFDVQAIARTLPETATTLLVDRYLTDRLAASARVFRVYRPTPPHYHVTCDEYLYALSGRGTFWMKDPSTKAEFGPGQLLFFERGTVHAIPDILAEPLVFLSIDTPRREPTDIVWIRAMARPKHSWRATRVEARSGRSDCTEGPRPVAPRRRHSSYFMQFRLKGCMVRHEHAVQPILVIGK